jgi:hypothetical protein
MILIYCRKTTSRISYSMGLLLKTILGLEWQITNDINEFTNYQGAKILYGSERYVTDGLYIHAAELLNERGVHHVEPKYITRDGLPVLFPAEDSLCGLGFDPFSAAFYLTSRYEEYLPYVKDRFGRFEARESFSYKMGFLKYPVVDHYAMMLRQCLSTTFPFFEFPARSFRFIPTIDVDVAFAFKGRGLIRTLYGGISSLVALDIKSIWQRLRVLAGQERDPFDTYDLQLSLHKKFGFKACYFFLCGDHGPYDKNIAVSSKPFQNLVKKIGDYATVGVHPSFSSNTDEKKISTEIRQLESILNRPVEYSRQHYLMLSMPKTYRTLMQNGVLNDFSMGYASLPGFRAGTCTPFYFYDIDNESVSGLKVFPLAIMDGTLKDYMRLNPQQAIQIITELMEKVRAVDGTFISLWHNDSFSDGGRWQGWLQVYKDMLTMAAS